MDYSIFCKVVSYLCKGVHIKNKQTNNVYIHIYIYMSEKTNANKTCYHPIILGTKMQERRIRTHSQETDISMNSPNSDRPRPFCVDGIHDVLLAGPFYKF